MPADIAPARTFGFEWELDQMRNMGLIRGATLENAVCFDRTDVINPGGLRFPDECCRHKVLDLIGDLALIGKPSARPCDRRTRGTRHARGAGSAHHVRSDTLRNPDLSISLRRELPTRWYPDQARMRALFSLPNLLTCARSRSRP